MGQKRTIRFSSFTDSIIAAFVWGIWGWQAGVMVALLLIGANVASIHSMYYHND